MNTSPDLEDQLKHSLDRLTEGARLCDGVAPLIRRRARHSQRTRYTALTGVTAVVAAAATLTAATGPAAPSGTRLPTQAYLVSHVTAALAAPGQAREVFHVAVTSRVTGSGPVRLTGAQFWSDRDAVRMQLPPLNVGYHRTASGWTGKEVDYRTKTWSVVTPQRNTNPYGPAALGATWTSILLAGCPRQTPATVTNWRAFLIDLLRCGHYEVTGYHRVAGVEALGLTRRTSPSPAASVVRTLWVDAATYLPVEEYWNWSMGGAVISTSQTRFRWLPPTPANLARLAVVVPPGFHRTGPAGS